MKKHILFICCQLTLVVVFFSCKDPNSIAGSNYLLDGTLINTQVDTFSVKAYTVRENPLRTDGVNGSTAYILGNMDDPIFGKSFASIYTQLRLPSNDIDLGTPTTLDSVVLTLEYSGFYGSLETLQSVRVYQITEAMDKDSKYYSDKEFDYNIIPLGQKDRFLPNVADSIYVLGDLKKPHLRIRLNDSFGDSLLAQSGGTNFSNNEVFLDYFKGLFITTDVNRPGKGMMYFDLNSSLSKLTVYYHSDTVASTLDLKINSSSAKSNLFTHDHSSIINNALNDTLDSILYVQSMAGVKAKIMIPFDKIRSLGKIAINKAELVFSTIYADTGIASTFTPPAQMYCIRDSAATGNVNALVIDMLEGSSYYGGFRNDAKNKIDQSIYTYKFNLSNHFQAILNDAYDDHGLLLITFPSSQISDRVLIGSGNHSTSSIQLNLTYTKLD